MARGDYGAEDLNIWTRVDTDELTFFVVIITKARLLVQGWSNTQNVASRPMTSCETNDQDWMLHFYLHVHNKHYKDRSIKLTSTVLTWQFRHSCLSTPTHHCTSIVDLHTHRVVQTDNHSPLLWCDVRSRKTYRHERLLSLEKLNVHNLSFSVQNIIFSCPEHK